MSDYPHLHPECVKKLSLSVEDRILEISSPRWFGYPRAHEAMQKFEDLLKHPRIARMPNLLLVGRTNNGKTDLLQRFCQNHLPDPNTNGGHINAPVMYVQSPPSPNEADLYATILSSLYERVPAASTSAKRTRTVEVLRHIGLKVLCLDEMHNSLAGSPLKRQHFLNAIKFLGNELRISFIACGTEDVLRATSIDPQIQNRFQPILLPKWKHDKEFLQLLRTFEAILPLKEPSILYDGILSRKIYAISEGTIGELSLLLNQAAIYSLRSGAEKITAETISLCGYIPPSDRSREAGRV